jgi:ATP-binding cassette subfamily B protein
VTSSRSLESLAWPPGALGEAAMVLARLAGLVPSETSLPARAEAIAADPDGFLDVAAERLDVDIEAVRVPYPELGDVVARMAPAIVRVQSAQGPRFVAVLRSGSTKARIVTREGVVTVPASWLRAAVAGDMEVAPGREVDAMLAGLALSGSSAARRVLLDNLLAHVVIEGVWLLRAPASKPMPLLARTAKLWRHVAVFGASLVVQAALGMLSWVVMGRMTLGGRVDMGWMAGWALLCMTTIPIDVAGTWAVGRLSIDLGAVLKQRLLLGAARISASEARLEGPGRLFGTVVEAEALESAALSGALLGLSAVIELVTAGAILAIGAGGALHVGLLIGWLLFTVIACRQLFAARATWTDARLGLTARFIESVLGHRTRRAQEPAMGRHDAEDQELESYLEKSVAADTWQHRLAAFPTRGWLLVALVGLVPAMLSTSTPPIALAVAVAGILQAQRAFGKVAQAAGSWMSVVLAWRSVGPLFHAAARKDAPSRLPIGGASAAGQGTTGPALLARRVSYRYGHDGRPALDGCSLAIPTGARVLVEGESGGGKSTFAGLLAGLRQPDEGLLLANGLDRATLGARGWRRRVAYAPQFHENHVFAGTVAFNVLMGKVWPPRVSDVNDAEKLLRELDLGPLLDRMPSGMNQLVGETGWQLSHGERSRVFLARALMQGADVVVLDEAFAALDPVTQQRALRVAANRSKTLVVIAHP